MKKIHFTIFVIILILPSIYGLDNDAYVENVMMRIFFFAEKPILIEEADYQYAYSQALFHPDDRAENILDIDHDIIKLNKTKATKLLKELNRTLQNDPRIKVTEVSFSSYYIIYKYKHKKMKGNEYFINIEPWGFYIAYHIPYKMSLEEFHKERIMFLNETKNLFEKARIFDLRYYYYPQYNISSGIAFTQIIKVFPKNNETYRKLLGVDKFNTIEDNNMNLTLIYYADEAYKDAFFIGENLPFGVSAYAYPQLLEYSKLELKKHKKILKEKIPKILDDILENLSNDMSSNDVMKIIENLSFIKNETIKYEFENVHKGIASLYAFVKISKEIKKRKSYSPVTHVLFDKYIDNAIALESFVNKLSKDYELYDYKRKSILDITKVIYSSSLQKENLNEQLKSIKNKLLLQLF